MARKKKHEENENLERWLVSYADFITLLFAFFVVMYSISSINEGKYRVLSDALVAAFRSTPRSIQPIQVGHLAKAPVNAHAQTLSRPSVMSSPIQSPIPQLPAHGESPTPIPPLSGAAQHWAHSASEPHSAQPPQSGTRGAGAHGAMSAQATALEAGAGVKVLKHIAREIQRELAPLVKQGLIKVRRHPLWVEVEIRTNILFPSGSADLSHPAVGVLNRIAGILKPFPNAIHVEGFTDNVPINTVAYPSNWELSAARAASVVHLFVQDGVNPHRMAAIGYGQYRPVASNATAAGRSRNRRVVLVVLAGTDTRTLLDSATVRRLEGGGRAGTAKKPAPVATPPATGSGAPKPAAAAKSAGTGP